MKRRLDEKGGIDTYIATTICLTILLVFVAATFMLTKVMGDYTSLQRTMDQVVDGVKTYGGYTETTHRSVQHFLDGRRLPKGKVRVYAESTTGGYLTANPHVYGEDVKVTLVYEYNISMVGLQKTYQISVSSTAVSQFIEGAAPEQCYIATNGGVLVEDKPSCSQWTTPVSNTPDDDFFWR